MIAVVWAATVWWKPLPVNDADTWGLVYAAEYDRCLAGTGSKVRCNAWMRVRLRDDLRSAGFSDQEIDEGLRKLARGVK
jgi:hypothetical protein